KGSPRSRSKLPMQVEKRGMRIDGRLESPHRAGDQPARRTLLVEGRQLLRSVVRELRIGLLVLERQCDPGLYAVHRPALAPTPLEALGMRDTAARGHPVHLPGPDRLL